MSSREVGSLETGMRSGSFRNGQGTEARLRVIMAAPSGIPGPMPRIAELLADGLRSEGVLVTLLAWGGGGRSLVDRAFGRLRQLLAIWRAVLAGRPDVLLIQTAHDWRSVLRDGALLLAVRGSGCTVVLQLHGSRADRLTEAGRTVFKFATRRLLSRVGGVLVLSSEEAQIFSRLVPETKVYAVANPFVAGADPPPGQSVPRSSPVILFAGRLLPDKGILDTVEAFALLRRRRPARLFIAGDGPAAEEVARMVREHGLSADVTVAGRLDPAELGCAYRGADVFVLPTYHPEGFPTVLSEAMYAGLPIVTTRIRGSADHLVEGTNALFVPARRPNALADSLERLLADPALRARMAAANRAKVREFAPERVAPAYVSALAEIRS